jgi:photosystem II stability/assembly factor-like uncharacterized protein
MVRKRKVKNESIRHNLMKFRDPPFILNTIFLNFLVTFWFTASCRTAEPVSRDAVFLSYLSARGIGPAGMSGRVTDVAVVENKPSVMYIGSASGGVWKTVNNGTTWTPIFDRQDNLSIGAVAAAAGNPEIVWVGTGEANARNSVSWGNGVYKSADGGKSWRHMGLADSAHIGRIVIHPQDSKIVYVAALGRLWGPNNERGIYKTTDSGRTWQRVKFINSDTGFIDLVMDPKNPHILYAAAYQVRRGIFAGGNPALQTGEGSGLYKSSDGGDTWVKLERGLPKRPLGRCGLAIFRKDPRIVYAVVQTDKTSAGNTGQAAKTAEAPDSGGVFRSVDHGETWSKVNDLCPRPFYYGKICIDPNDEKRVYVLGIQLHVSFDGGKSFANNGAPNVHFDHHALWIDPRESDHLVLAGDGGVNFSYDRGATWEHLDNLPLGQFYGVAVDMRKPYRIYGGLQDNGTWCGPSATRNSDGITNSDWSRILDADGFHCQVDPFQPDLVFAESQWGALHRLDLRTGAEVGIRPRANNEEPAFRFNWKAPIILSAHLPRTLYFAGNYLFRSKSDGDRWEILSPDLTRGTAGASADFGHTISTIAESPIKPGLLVAGTDDGRIHITRNAGQTWTELTDRIPNFSGDGWISRIECSHFSESTVYVTIDRHRHDDPAPYVFKSTDYGMTWQSLAKELPAKGWVHVIRESSRNPDLLFVGTEFGLSGSLDGGRHWYPLRNGLPPVAIDDLVIHPRDRELVVATHGRSIYVIDLAPLEDLNSKILAEDAYLFEPQPVTVFQYRGSHGLTGAKAFAAPNPLFGATIHYYLKNAMTGPILITIKNELGQTVVNLNGGKEAGLHKVLWNLRVPATNGTDQPQPLVPHGEYSVQIKLGNRVLTRTLRVEAEE